MFKTSKRIFSFSLVIAILSLFFAALYINANSSPTFKTIAEFEKLPLEIADYGLFDLGIADTNQDSLLDIFTSSHSGVQNVLINQGDGKFTDSFAEFKLDQDHNFPGLAVMQFEPNLTKPGLYINWSGPSILVHAYKLDELELVSGKIKILSPVAIESKKNMDVVVNQEKQARGLTHSVIEFSGKGESEFSFKPFLHALPIEFEIDPKLMPAKIFVGSGFITPANQRFSINMRDRHGMAWADYNGDGQTDVYIGRGGEKGWMGRLPYTYWDELFVAKDNAFEDIGKTSGLVKNGCSGRQVAWIDYNIDNRLDVYVSCGNEGEYQPNILFEQQADGGFIDVASKVGLAIGSEGSFVWIDSDSDKDLDLFWVDKSGFYLYENHSGKFAAIRLGGNRADSVSEKLSISDFDSDGDQDVFSSSPSGNVLCVNNNGSYTLTDPVLRGLPDKSNTAIWLDFENDGSQDLYAVPSGLYLQKESGKFKSTGQFSNSDSKFAFGKVTDAHAAWFDFDNDGNRDLIVALNYSIKQKWWAQKLASFSGINISKLGGYENYWDTYLLRNKMPATNHWLQIELIGLAGNRTGIGSTVTVKTSKTSQVQQVGASEGSRYSQGHYRLYFGVGETDAPATVHVKWSDGFEQTITDVKPDQLFTVKRQ